MLEMSEGYDWLIAMLVHGFWQQEHYTASFTEDTFYFYNTTKQLNEMTLPTVHKSEHKKPKIDISQYKVCHWKE